MKQVSARIREIDEKYLNACRVVFESAAAEAESTGKSEQLKEKMEAIYEEYEKL
jgi:hypothetical protein